MVNTIQRYAAQNLWGLISVRVAGAGGVRRAAGTGGGRVHQGFVRVYRRYAGTSRRVIPGRARHHDGAGRSIRLG